MEHIGTRKQYTLNQVTMYYKEETISLFMNVLIVLFFMSFPITDMRAKIPPLANVPNKEFSVPNVKTISQPLLTPNCTNVCIRKRVVFPY